MSAVVDFNKPLFGYRFADTYRGDSLQVIAAREMGDATQWQTLIDYNGLIPPYITDDPSQAGPGVILTGAMILVPAPVPVATVTTDPNAVFGTDMKLINNGQLAVANGDFDVVSGRDNLKQALGNRVETPRGGLLMHQDYGSLHPRLIGSVNGPTSGLLAAKYVEAAVQADSRVQSVISATATITGDVTAIEVEAQPIAGTSIQFSATT